MTDVALDLLNDAPFRNELAQIGARAAVSELESDTSIRWRYRSERVIRNLSAIGQRLFDVARNESSASEHRVAALTAAQGWEHLATLREGVHPSAALLNSALFYELAGYQATRGSLHFPVDRPLPTELVARLLDTRLAEAKLPPTGAR